jgi:hypothetical protein
LVIEAWSPSQFLTAYLRSLCTCRREWWEVW